MGPGQRHGQVRRDHRGAGAGRGPGDQQQAGGPGPAPRSWSGPARRTPGPAGPGGRQRLPVKVFSGHGRAAWARRTGPRFLASLIRVSRLSQANAMIRPMSRPASSPLGRMIYLLGAARFGRRRGLGDDRAARGRRRLSGQARRTGWPEPSAGWPPSAAGLGHWPAAASSPAGTGSGGSAARFAFPGRSADSDRLQLGVGWCWPRSRCGSQVGRGEGVGAGGGLLGGPGRAADLQHRGVRGDATEIFFTRAAG